MKLSDFPCAVLLAAFASGILMMHSGTPTMLILLPALAGITLFVILRKRSNRSASDSITLGREHWWWSALIFLALGMGCEYIHSIDTLDFGNLRTPVALKGVVQEKSTLKGNERLTIKINGIIADDDTESAATGRICVYSNPTRALPGDIVRIPYNLYPTENKFLLRDGIRYSQRCNDSDIEIAGRSRSFSVLASKLRDSLESSLHDSGLNPNTAQLLSALLLGDRDALDPELRESFSRAGVAHILALSGMHLAIIASFCFWLLIPVGAIAGRRWKIFATILALWVFAVITGLSATVVRACIMATFCLTALMSERKNSPLNALCAAALFILFFNPALLFNAGLQFSFVTVAALVIAFNPADSVNRRKHPKRYRLINSISVSIIATTAALGLTAYYFHRIPLLFPIANLILLPLLPPFIGFAAILMFCTEIGLHVPLLPEAVDTIAAIFRLVADNVASIRWGNIFFAVSGAAAVAYTAAALLLACATKLKSKRTAFAGCGMLLGAILLVFVTDTDADAEGRRITYDSALRTYNRDESFDYQLPEKGLWRMDLPQGRIIGICDNEISKREKRRDRGKETETSLPANPKPCDILVIGRGYRGSLPHLLRYYSPKKVVVLNDVWKSHASELKSEGKAMEIEVHCIGFDGEFEL